MKGVTASDRDLFEAISDNDVELVLSLVTGDAACLLDIDRRDKTHGLQTALMRLCHMHITTQQRAAILDAIAQRQPDVNIQDGAGRTVLCHACIAERMEVLGWLADQPGLDPNLADNDGNTALIYAVRSGNSALVRCLLLSFKHIDSNCTNNKGQCALSEATKRHDSALCRLLIDEGGADTSVLDYPNFPSPKGAQYLRPSTPRRKGSPQTPRRVAVFPMRTQSLQPLLVHNALRGLWNHQNYSSSEPDLQGFRFREANKALLCDDIIDRENSSSCNSLPDLQEEGSSEEEMEPPNPAMVGRRKNSLSMPDLREDLAGAHPCPSPRLNSRLSRPDLERQEKFPQTGSPLLQRRLVKSASKDVDPVPEVEEEHEDALEVDCVRMKQRRNSTSLPDLRGCPRLIQSQNAADDRSDNSPVSDEEVVDLSSTAGATSGKNGGSLTARCGSALYRLPQLSLNHQVACSLPNINCSPSRQGFHGSALMRKTGSGRPARGSPLALTPSASKLGQQLTAIEVNGRRGRVN